LRHRLAGRSVRPPDHGDGARQPGERRLRTGGPEHERHARAPRGYRAAVSAPIVLKCGGELLDDPGRLAGAVAAIAAVNRRDVPLVVVHGGGKEIDAALRAAGIEKRQVDGLRITDRATLDVVVSVLAGTINTRFVA